MLLILAPGQTEAPRVIDAGGMVTWPYFVELSPSVCCTQNRSQVLQVGSLDSAWVEHWVRERRDHA